MLFKYWRTRRPTSGANAHPTKHLILCATLAWGCALGLPAQAQQADIAGIDYPEMIKAEGVPLVLNGSGISYKAVAKLYTMALYLPQKSDQTPVVLKQEGPKQLQFVILRGARIDELGRTISVGIERNNPREEFFRLIPAIQRMGEQFSRINRFATGDRFSIEWVPDRGTLFRLNGRPVDLPIADPGFFQAVLNVWLGKAPASENLKTALLDYHPPLLNVLD